MAKYNINGSITSIADNDFLSNLKSGDVVFSVADNKSYVTVIADNNNIEFKYYDAIGVTIATYEYNQGTNNYSYGNTVSVPFSELDIDSLPTIDIGDIYGNPDLVLPYLGKSFVVTNNDVGAKSIAIPQLTYGNTSNGIYIWTAYTIDGATLNMQEDDNLIVVSVLSGSVVNFKITPVSGLNLKNLPTFDADYLADNHYSVLVNYVGRALVLQMGNRECLFLPTINNIGVSSSTYIWEGNMLNPDSVDVEIIRVRALLTVEDGEATDFEIQPVESGGGGSFDDMEVEIATSDAGTDSSYAEPITGLQFKENCESGVYTTVGTIARIKNLNTGDKFRVILIGTNHDILAKSSSDGSTKAKTTWHFYDIPASCKSILGLPFNIIDWGTDRGRAYANAYLDGTNTDALTWYPSNKTGYPTAVGLHHVLHSMFESLPLTLQASIKLVSKTIHIPRAYRNIAANGGVESDACRETTVAEMLFCLSMTEAGESTSTYTAYFPEGNRYAWMTTTNNRKRYCQSNAVDYWTRSTRNGYEAVVSQLASLNSTKWGYVSYAGNLSSANTNNDLYVCPAFCI